MADIRCPNCGKDNPDFLDTCQFCQMPLNSESMIQTGDTPTKKDTGELEAILPAWLKDVRQQSRDSAAEDAMEAATSPQVQKDAAPDLLAGLANQSASDDEEIPDWLAGLNPVGEKESPEPAVSEDSSSSDFFAQFTQEESTPAPSADESVKEEAPSWMGDEAQTPEPQKDELDEWLSRASEQPDEPFRFDSDTPQNAQEPEESKELEDLSWLHDLEASSKQTESSAPQTDMGWVPNLDSQPSDSQGGDLDWLNNLGGMSLPASDEPAASQKATPSQGEEQGEDLDWLRNLGGDSEAPSEESPAITPTPPQEDLDWLKNLGGETSSALEEPPTAEPTSSQGNLDWLNNLGDTSAPALDEPTPAQPASSQDDLDWLKNLGSETTPAEEPASEQTAPPQNDLDWLNNLGGTPAVEEAPTMQPFADQENMERLDNSGGQQSAPVEESPTVSPFSSRDTGPLVGITDDMTPDWLKSATEEPSMPPPGAASMEWFKAQEEQTPPAAPEPASVQPGAPSSDEVSSSISSQDVDSMFAVEMPDWLSQKPGETDEPSSQASAPSTPTNDSLSPVDLPSWVQAMRPVEAGIDEISAGSADQVTEKEGPLAGFRGLIPFAPIGSSRRPKAISLKLQATDEQQANAALLEQLIAGETSVHSLKSPAIVASQRALRIALAILFWLVLGAVIGLGSQAVPVVAPAEVAGLSNLVATIPDGSPVLVVIDYEPSLVGELEAASGPVLDQMALSRHTKFTFLSTSPNSSALVERLMHNTNISKPAPDGLGYQLGSQYFNIGFLPGGSAGVLEFVEAPAEAVPLIKEEGIEKFSEFAAVVVLTDHAESSRIWVEQLEQEKQKNPALASQVLLVVSSAQSGPLLQPYVSSGQVNAMISGLSDAARYEYINNTRPGIARTYWDAFDVGLLMAIALIVVGSLWSLISGIRTRRAEAELG